MTGRLNVKGFEIFESFLDLDACRAMVSDIRRVVQDAPLRAPVTPFGKPMSVRMTSAGSLGWVTDRRGYRYESCQANGTPWPAIPVSVLEVWRAVSGCPADPDACLVNFYGEGSRMGLHSDNDEGDFSFPVVSISLGDDALFRMGNVERGGKTTSYWLRSGDVVVMGGDARLAHHGIDRIRFGSSTLLPKSGRINLTLRVVRSG